MRFLTFTDQSFSYLPSENGWIFPFILFNFIDDHGSSDFRLRTANDCGMTWGSKQTTSRSSRVLVITTLNYREIKCDDLIMKKFNNISNMKASKQTD